MVASFSPPYPSGPHPLPAVKRPAYSRQLEEACRARLGVASDWPHSLPTSTSRHPTLRPWRRDSMRLLRNTIYRTGRLRMREEAAPCTFCELRWPGRGCRLLERQCGGGVAWGGSPAGNWKRSLRSATGEADVWPLRGCFRGLGLSRCQSPGSEGRLSSSRRPRCFSDASAGS